MSNANTIETFSNTDEALAFARVASDYHMARNPRSTIRVQVWQEKAGDPIRVVSRSITCGRIVKVWGVVVPQQS